jgi:hypothetical protein
MTNKLYVIARADLPYEQQAVQAAHAATEWARTTSSRYFPHPTFVFLNAQNRLHLTWIQIKLILANKDYVLFREPDLGNQVTAIAIHLFTPQNNKRLFDKLPLMKF